MKTITKAQKELLFACLLSDGENYNCSAYGDIKVGSTRISGRKLKAAINLEEMGLAHWDHAKIFSPRNLFDIQLSPKGYRYAIHFLMAERFVWSWNWRKVK